MDDDIFVVGYFCDEQLNSAAIDPSATALSCAKLSALTRLSERVQQMATPCNEFGRMVLHATSLAISLQGTTDPVALAPALSASGFDVVLRKAIGGASAGENVFRSLRHEFLVVRGSGEFRGMEFIVEPSLRQHFLIPHPSPEYEYVLSRTPDVFVGGSCRLAPLVQLLCALMADSFQRQDQPLPPWRTEAAMLSKWLPQPHLFTDSAMGSLVSSSAALALSSATSAAAAAAAAASPPPPPSRPVASTHWLFTRGSLAGQTTMLQARALGSPPNSNTNGCRSSSASSSSDDVSNASVSSSSSSGRSSSGSVAFDVCSGGSDVYPPSSQEDYNSCADISISITSSSISISSVSSQGPRPYGGRPPVGADVPAAKRAMLQFRGKQSPPGRRVVWGFESRHEHELQQKQQQQQQQQVEAGRSNKGATACQGGRQGALGRVGYELDAGWRPLLPNEPRWAPQAAAVAAAVAVAVADNNANVASRPAAFARTSLLTARLQAVRGA
ncbi:hypothetical protein PLESTB_001786100 [Pleodorina starrii]|uniref:Uncharacterized protein n=1 Tax=Pleodorina starrii TaxID=330485 RepID=A0A9W6C0H5_9CHLO|nr:hypothetical protein PLESTM_001756900 [Pleodorina starrii]GLC61643.1 hypothetical protein PLESTB_001786100 [Pleodorina starrii]GLC76534.1 hypothetical protein PLESTF_001793600 [Pleodorina starrii]